MELMYAREERIIVIDQTAGPYANTMFTKFITSGPISCLKNTYTSGTAKEITSNLNEASTDLKTFHGLLRIICVCNQFGVTEEQILSMYVEKYLKKRYKMYYEVRDLQYELRRN